MPKFSTSERGSGAAGRDGGALTPDTQEDIISAKNKVFKMYLDAYRAPGRGFQGIDMNDYPEFREAEKAMDDLIARGIAAEADRKFMKKEAQRRHSFEKHRGE